jgi:YVTN family beta-propeller protein
VYCANLSSNNVIVIDGASNSVIATVAAGVGPRALCYNARDNKVYCANNSDSSVTVIDGVGDSVIATVLVRRGPCALCYNPTNDKVYCADSARNMVSVISGAGDAVIATIPTGTMPRALCYNPKNNKVYCAVWGSNQVTVIDGGTNSVIATVHLLRDEPMACCCDAQDNKVYVAGRGDFGMNAGVSVIDGASNDTILSIATDFGSRDLCLNPVQNRVYVANRESPTISVIRDSIYEGVEEGSKPQDSSRKPAATLARSLPPGAVAFDAMGRRVLSPRSGIFFVREAQAQAIRKVVIQR